MKFHEVVIFTLWGNRKSNPQNTGCSADMCFERKIAPPSNASLRFSIQKASDAGLSLQQTIKDTNAELNSLQTPKPAVLLDSAVGVGTTAVDTVQSVVNTWQPLLDKLQIFCQAMDGIAAVCYLLFNLCYTSG